MSQIMPCDKVEYRGVDIVESIIRKNIAKFSTAGVEFKLCDLVLDPLPKAQLVFSRDFLFHLSYSDTAAYFGNLLSAAPAYFMTTSHINDTGFKNADIVTGGWRWIDLFAYPYSFSAHYETAVSDGGGDRFMYLWSFEQIAPCLEAFVRQCGDDTHWSSSR